MSFSLFVSWACWLWLKATNTNTLSVECTFRKRPVFGCVFHYVTFDSVGRPGVFQGTPLFTIVGQWASEARCGSLDCLPRCSQHTDMEDLSKTRAWEGISVRTPPEEELLLSHSADTVLNRHMTSLQLRVAASAGSHTFFSLLPN